jgi:YD repeat-containing protein
MTLTGQCTGGGVIYGTLQCGKGYDATTCTPNGTPKIEKNLGPSGCGEGNPIFPNIGNKIALETDYQDTEASPLRMARTYNSQGIGIVGWSGNGWTHAYGANLKVINTSAVLVQRSEGKRYFYALVNGVWSADSDIPWILTQQKDAGGVTIGWKLSVKDDQVETYDASGNLISIKDRDGFTQTLTYTTGSLTKVTDNFGNSLNFTYNAAGQMATMTDPAGNITRYGYDGSGNLKTVTYPDATPAVLTDNPKKTYVYGSDTGELVNTANVSQPNALTGIIDENGVRFATYKYDANGKAISTEHAGSVEKYALAYAADGSSTSITDPLGAIRTTHFTTVLGVVKSTGSDQPGGSGCAAASSAMTYDTNGNVASRTDFNGHKVCYGYDLSRNLETARVEGLASGADCAASLSASSLPLPARKVTTEWDARFRLSTKVTEPGLETTYTYDSKANITHKGLKDLVTNKIRAWDTTYTYSATGILLQKAEDGSRTDVNDIVTYEYYPEDAVCTGGHFGCRGQLKQVTDALGHITKINRYSANGQPEIVVDPNGLTMTMTYDVRQRLKSLDVGGELTTYTYDPAGLLAKATQPNGAYLEYTYDNAHRLTKVKDHLGNTRTYTLDNMGNRIKEDLTDPNGLLARSQTKVYDALSRLQNLVLPQ